MTGEWWRSDTPAKTTSIRRRSRALTSWRRLLGCSTRSGVASSDLRARSSEPRVRAARASRFAGRLCPCWMKLSDRPSRTGSHQTARAAEALSRSRARHFRTSHQWLCLLCDRCMGCRLPLRRGSLPPDKKRYSPAATAQYPSNESRAYTRSPDALAWPATKIVFEHRLNFATTQWCGCAGEVCSEESARILRVAARP